MWGSASVDTIVTIPKVKAENTKHRHKDTNTETCGTLDVKRIVLGESSE